jgi:hypothetical protein
MTFFLSDQLQPKETSCKRSIVFKLLSLQVIAPSFQLLCCMLTLSTSATCIPFSWSGSQMEVSNFIFRKNIKIFVIILPEIQITNFREEKYIFFFFYLYFSVLFMSLEKIQEPTNKKSPLKDIKSLKLPIYVVCFDSSQNYYGMVCRCTIILIKSHHCRFPTL